MCRTAPEGRRSVPPLVSLVVSDPSAYAWGGELLLRDDEPAGFASSAAFGHTVGRTVLLGYLERHAAARPTGMAEPGPYQVAIGGERYEASVSLQLPYDPSGARSGPDRAGAGPATFRHRHLTVRPGDDPSPVAANRSVEYSTGRSPSSYAMRSIAISGSPTLMPSKPDCSWSASTRDHPLDRLDAGHL